MRKTHYILISTLILISVLIFFLLRTDDKLKGTWIGEYTINSESSSDFKVVFAEQNLMTFKNNKCYSQGSKNMYGTGIRESNNMLFFKKVIFKSKTPDEFDDHYEILKIEYDSLVLQMPNSQFLKIYRKLSDNLKHNQKIDLVGKRFFWKNRMFQDSIYFKTDSTLTRESIKRPDYRTSSWERINHDGFDILLMDGDVPYLIENQNGKTINLRTFHKTDIEHTMKELE